MAITLRQLCIEKGRRPAKALFFFPEEYLTGIAPTRKIIEKEIGWNEGTKVTVNWEGRMVPAEILALNGKFTKTIHVIAFYTFSFSSLV